MAFVRKKTVTMDGVSVDIAPLFSREVDDLFAQQKAIVESDQPVEQKAKSLAATWMVLIAQGLNRARTEDEFTVERLDKEFDKVFLEFIRSEIADMSGIEIRKQSMGEAKALSTSAS